MPTVNGKTPGLSNLVLKSHPWMDVEGWGVEIATTAAAMGQVVVKTGGNWAAITAVPSAGAVVGVVMDETKEDPTKKRVLKYGDAILKESGLVYFTGATGANKLAVQAFLEANRIQVNEAAQVIARA
jgi:hypothetical protein